MSRPLALLDHRFPLPLDRPFTTGTARQAGLDSRALAELMRRGLIRRPLRGTYAAAQLPDTVELRARVLSLVAPPGAVVTDRTAGWLHVGDRILAPNDHLATPLLSVFDSRSGHRLRNDLCASGERRMRREDVMDIGGLTVTTPLRTCLDLGRLLPRDQSFAALDAMLAVVGRDEMLAAIERFRGYRGVRQLRALAPLADKRAASQGESILRLRWLDCPSLPLPDRPQIQVDAPDGGNYFIDLGIAELRFGVEYDGAQWHDEDRREHDLERRRWIREQQGWVLPVVRRRNVFGARRDVEQILHRGITESRKRLSRVTPRRLDTP